MPLNKKLLLFFVILSSITFLSSENIEYFIKTNHLYTGEDLNFKIKLTWGEEEKVKIDFPENPNFLPLSLLRISKESGKSYVSNKILNFSSIVYVLSSKKSGQFQVPSLILKVQTNQSNTLADPKFITTPVFNLTIDQKKQLKSFYPIIVKVLMTLFFLTLSVFFIKFRRQKLIIKRDKDLAEIYKKYKEILLQEKELKFQPDKKPYLVFLVKVYKKFFHEIKETSVQDQNRALYNDVLKIEDSLVYQASNPKTNGLIQKYITDIENTILG